MKKRTYLALFLLTAMLVSLAACGSNPETEQSDIEPPPGGQEELEIPKYEMLGQILLYGGIDGNQMVLNHELELWHLYYHSNDLRNVFIQAPYYTAQFLNLWMQSNNDDILDQLYEDWAGTAIQVPAVKLFYQTIKAEYPETIFHGTDVGHQYDTTGARYLSYLEDNGQADSTEYTLAQECIEQGQTYYQNRDDSYRENKLFDNFVREYDALKGESAFGIFDGDHIILQEAADNPGGLLTMADMLYAHYGDAVTSVDLRVLIDNPEPQRQDTITVNGKEYTATYFGEQDISASSADFPSREFWRLEDAYNDFRAAGLTGDMLPYDNYPMLVEEGQVFVVDYHLQDGSIQRHYYRADGNLLEDRVATEEFTVQ